MSSRPPPSRAEQYRDYLVQTAWPQHRLGLFVVLAGIASDYFLHAEGPTLSHPALDAVDAPFVAAFPPLGALLRLDMRLLMLVFSLSALVLMHVAPRAYAARYEMACNLAFIIGDVARHAAMLRGPESEMIWLAVRPAPGLFALLSFRHQLRRQGVFHLALLLCVDLPLHARRAAAFAGGGDAASARNMLMLAIDYTPETSARCLGTFLAHGWLERMTEKLFQLRLDEERRRRRRERRSGVEGEEDEPSAGKRFDEMPRRRSARAVE